MKTNHNNRLEKDVYKHIAQNSKESSLNTEYANKILRFGLIAQQLHLIKQCKTHGVIC